MPAIPRCATAVKGGTNIGNYMGGKKRVQELFSHTREDHALNVDLCVNFVNPIYLHRYPGCENWVVLQK